MTLDKKRARQILAHLKETGQGFCYVPGMAGSAIIGMVSREDMEKLTGIAKCARCGRDETGAAYCIPDEQGNCIRFESDVLEVHPAI